MLNFARIGPAGGTICGDTLGFSRPQDRKRNCDGEGGDAASRSQSERLASAALTPRETEVLSWLAKGKTNRDIAETMGLSESNIGVILFRAMKQLKELMRTEAL